MVVLSPGTLMVRKVAVYTEASKADVCPPWRVTRGFDGVHPRRTALTT